MEVSELLNRPPDPEREKRLALGHLLSTIKRRGQAAPQTETAIRFAAHCGASLQEIAAATGIPNAKVQNVVART